MHNVCDFTLNNAMQILPKMGDLDALEYPHTPTPLRIGC